MGNILDFDKLLADIPGEKPAGENLRSKQTSIYHEAGLAIDRARRAERKQFEGEQTDAPDWEPVFKLVPTALATQSKDIDLAVWLLEALARKHHFAGLREGVVLVRQLVERFWDRGLHPDGIDLSERLHLLGALNGEPGRNGTLIRPIQTAPLTTPRGPLGPFCLLNYQEAARAAASKKPPAPDAITSEKITQAEAQTSPDLRKQIMAAISGCLEEWEILGAVLTKKCRGCTPFASEDFKEAESLVVRLKEHSDPFSEFLWSRLADPNRELLAQSAGSKALPDSLLDSLAEQLNAIAEGEAIYDPKRFADVELSEDVQELLNHKPSGSALHRLNRILLEEGCALERPSLAPSNSIICQTLSECHDLLRNAQPEEIGDKSKEESGAGSTPVDDPGDGDTKKQAPPSRSGPLGITTRRQAFQVLAQVAQYFDDTEPHSPVSYALRRIVHWGDLKLPKLLTELIRNQDAREEVYKLLGISEPKEEPPKPK